MVDEKTRKEAREEIAEDVKPLKEPTGRAHPTSLGGEKRPVHVTEENRPPGDPGGGVDIQEHVGGQPGRADPGQTGGPSHAEVGAPEPPGEPESDPEAGNHRLAGRERARQAKENAAAEDQPDAGPDTDLERQFREKTERPLDEE